MPAYRLSVVGLRTVKLANFSTTRHPPSNNIPFVRLVQILVDGTETHPLVRPHGTGVGGRNLRHTDVEPAAMRFLVASAKQVKKPLPPVFFTHTNPYSPASNCSLN